MEELKHCLAHFVEQQAVLRPDQPAVVSRQGETSYKELLQRVNSLSAWLVGKGIGQESRVGVCADRSLAWVVGTLGVLWAGGVYIPVDPMAPLQRKARMLEDASVRLLLIEPHLLTALPDSIEIAMLDGERPAAKTLNKRPKVIPGQAAYGICTSGSTGTPKNVIISHESLLNYAVVLHRELKLSDTDRYLHTASLAFSSSIRQLIAPLVSGGAVVIATREEIRDPMSLVSRMLQAGVTVFDVVPSYLARWLAAVWECPRDWRDKLALSLRLVITASERADAAAATSMRSLLPWARILNLYGNTETTGVVAMHEVGGREIESIPIGQPLGPYDFYVLDDYLNPADEGELYISGPCLARCYDGRTDATASHFLADPFSEAPGTRMYRTGDHVRRLNGGSLEFKGRTDDQVKVHGIRLELGEINAALLQHPDVGESATVLQPMETQDPRLVSFVVMRPCRSSVTMEDLRAFLATTLPEVLIPVVVMVDELPRTASGKVDRPALMARHSFPATPRTRSIAPHTPMERLVAKCWEDVLRVTGIGIDDDFFALGGDSLQAIEMILRLQKSLQVTVLLGALFFQDPSLKAFVNAIEQEIGEAA